MPSVIVDTHILIWDHLDPGKLSAKAKKAIGQADANHQIVVCEITLWEIAMLINKKRLVIDMDYPQFMAYILISRNYILQGMSPEIAHVSANLQIATQDPADRIIAATSMVMGLPLVTSDKRILHAEKIQTIW